MGPTRTPLTAGRVVVLIPAAGADLAVPLALAKRGYCSQTRAYGERTDDASTLVVDARRPITSAELETAVGVTLAPVVVVASASMGDLLDLLRPSFVRHITSIDRDEGDDLATTLEALSDEGPRPMARCVARCSADRAHRVAIHTSEQRDETIAEVGELALRWGVHCRIAHAASTVADELLTNAVYNAPLRDGRRPYAALCRRTRVDLLDDARAELFVGCDGERLVLGVTDPFGSLSARTVRGALLRCLEAGEGQIEHKGGGAGLGLYTVAASSNALSIDITVGERTEITALLSIERSYRRFADLPKTVHIFERFASAGISGS